MRKVPIAEHQRRISAGQRRAWARRKGKLMNTIFETNFVVMPTDANYMYPLIFGGAFFSRMDLCAAITVSRFLNLSETCGTAVTHKSETEWIKPCYVGDLIYLRGQVTEVGKKSIVVSVVANRERRGNDSKDRVGSAKFVFVSLLKNRGMISLADVIASKPDLLPYGNHGLTLTPSNETLLRMAKENPPDQSWYDEKSQLPPENEQ